MDNCGLVFFGHFILDGGKNSWKKVAEMIGASGSMNTHTHVAYPILVKTFHRYNNYCK